jgi:hypothetical protein
MQMDNAVLKERKERPISRMNRESHRAAELVDVLNSNQAHFKGEDKAPRTIHHFPIGRVGM